VECTITRNVLFNTVEYTVVEKPSWCSETPSYTSGKNVEEETKRDRTLKKRSWKEIFPTHYARESLSGRGYMHFQACPWANTLDLVPLNAWTPSFRGLPYTSNLHFIGLVMKHWFFDFSNKFSFPMLTKLSLFCICSSHFLFCLLPKICILVLLTNCRQGCWLHKKVSFGHPQMYSKWRKHGFGGTVTN